MQSRDHAGLNIKVEGLGTKTISNMLQLSVDFMGTAELSDHYLDVSLRSIGNINILIQGGFN